MKKNFRRHLVVEHGKKSKHSRTSASRSKRSQSVEQSDVEDHQYEPRNSPTGRRRRRDSSSSDSSSNGVTTSSDDGDPPPRRRSPRSNDNDFRCTLCNKVKYFFLFALPISICLIVFLFLKGLS